MSSIKRAALILVGIHLVAGFLFLSPSYIRPDSVAVHSWLRSMVVDGDLLFYDEWAGFRMLEVAPASDAEAAERRIGADSPRMECAARD